MIIHTAFDLVCKFTGRGGRSAGVKSQYEIYYTDLDAGQHIIEDYIYDADSIDQDWVKIRRDIAGMKLYCLLRQCRRKSFLEMGYNIKVISESCAPTQEQCDVCEFVKEKGEITKIKVSEELKAIYEIIKQVISAERPIDSTLVLMTILKLKKKVGELWFVKL